jgi:membrane complex biogenesis BtpA family protein
MSMLFGRNETPMMIGVIHLLPLPGNPAESPGLAAVMARARADARALVNGGVNGLIVENLGDAPFAGNSAPAYTVAQMTRIAADLSQAHPDVPLGINVLRNDAIAALAIAAASGAVFIRVNVHNGAMVTDQGLLEGRARRTLGADQVQIAADVLVKHAVPLGESAVEDLAHDLVARAGARAVIVSGTGTGRPVDWSRVSRVRAAIPEHALWIGSGAVPDQAPLLRSVVDTVIVGTWLHEHSDLSRPVDERRVDQMRRALRG